MKLQYNSGCKRYKYNGGFMRLKITGSILLLLGLLLTLLLTLSGCGQKGTEIIFWNPFAGADGEVFQELVDGFNQEYEGVYYLNSQTTANDGNAYYDKIATAAQTGDTPDVAIMHIDQMPTYANSGVIKPWTSEELGEIGIDASMYSEAIINSAHYQDTLYSIPLDIHPLVMWVNQDLINVDELPTTWEQLQAYASYENDVYSVCLPGNPFVTNRLVYSAFLQNDVPIASSDQNFRKGYFSWPII